MVDCMCSAELQQLQLGNASRVCSTLKVHAQCAQGMCLRTGYVSFGTLVFLKKTYPVCTDHALSEYCTCSDTVL